MPVINIREVDNSQAGTIALDDYSVFIPGNATNPNVELNKVYSFTTLADFLETIGLQPVTYTGTDTPFMNEDGKIQDIGYLSARLLLSKGMHVLYKVPCKFVVGTVDRTGATEESITRQGTADDIILTGTTYSVVTETKVVTGTELVDETVANGYVAYVTDTVYSGYTFYDDNGEHPLTTMSSADLGTFKTTGSVEVGGVTYTNFTLTGTVYTGCSSTDTTLTKITDYTEMKEALNQSAFYDELKDRGLYSQYFVTTGGYFAVDTTTTIPNAVATIQSLATTRGDCVALVDHIWNASRNQLLPIATRVSNDYSAMYTPWCKYDIDSFNITVPASVAYLEAFAIGTANNPLWYAMAGPQRGVISGTPIRTYGEDFANTLQPDTGVSINPITLVTPYGIRIWGNRTLKTNSGLKRSSFMNIRMLCCQLKKQLYISAKGQMFEQNSDRLWVNFKSQIDKLLLDMVTGEGIEGYKIYKLPSNDVATVKAYIRIVPIAGAEKFDILLELSDTLAEVTLV